jgi:hypothetical protein
MDEETATARRSLDALSTTQADGMQEHEMLEREMQCCCGKPQCAFLQHNTKTLDSLERDLLSAAQIGQVWLLASVVCIAVSLSSAGAGHGGSRTCR